MRAFVIGGSGLIGRAICERLLRAGWRIDVAGRRPGHLPEALKVAGVRFHGVDRRDELALAGAYGPGADLLVDCACYTGADANGLLRLAREATSTVMVSSKAVYTDASGRHSNSREPPQFDGAIPETQSTLPAGDMDYRSAAGYGPNKVAAENVLLDSGLPVTILRPGKVHGPGARPAREWVYVKRALDRRPVVLLAGRGSGIDHPCAASNLAALVETVASAPGQRVLNIADPDAPSGIRIARIVAGHLRHEWDEVALEPEADPALGAHPWNRTPAIVLDTSSALRLGYRPAGNYEETVGEAIDWLRSVAIRQPGGVILPSEYDHPSFAHAFDYEREDAYVRARNA